MDKAEIDFLEAQEVVKPLVWLRCIEDIFFIWNESEEKLDKFLENWKFKKSSKFEIYKWKIWKVLIS